MNKLKKMLRNGFSSIEIDFLISPRWYIDQIPSEAGWYYIETNTPIEILKSIGKPKESRNYNIPQKIYESQYLIEKNLAITQIGKSPYIVYSGETKNLMYRAREHSFGGNGTGCLALNKYEILKQYTWIFSYFTTNSYDSNSNGNKSLRNLGEQIWRSQNTWPILCSQ